MLILKEFSTEFCENVDIKFNSGEITGIYGKNGVGKTSLVKYIAGFYDDYEGQLILDGETLKKGINKSCIMLLQNPYMQFVGNTIFDEITFNLEQNEFTNIEIDKILKKELQLPNNNLNNELRNLSGGEAQHLLLRNYLYLDKKIFICDETFSNMDNELKYSLLEELKSKDKIIIMVTNNMQDLNFCDAVYELENKQFKKIQFEKINYSILENNNETMLKVKDLKIEYLENKINVEFKEGINLLIAKSGSGKTSILNAIAGLEKYKGKIDNKIGSIFYISQFPFEQITTNFVYELLSKDQRVLNILKRLKIDSTILKKELIDVSTGQLVQILLIEALLSDKELILLDETFEVLDFQKQKEMLLLIQEYNKNVICITHNLYIFDNIPANVVRI